MGFGGGMGENAWISLREGRQRDEAYKIEPGM